MAATGLLVLLGIAGILIWGIKGSMGMQNVLKNKRFVKVLFIVYGLVLVASVFVFELLPKNESEFVRASENQLNKETERLDEAIFNGLTDEINPRFIINEWKWRYSKEELHIQQDQVWLDGTVVVERKPENDGLIEGTYYASSVMGGIDFTEDYPPRDVKMENDDTLHLVGETDNKDIRFALFEKEFVITQFTEERKNGIEFDGYRDVNYLYLKIPKDLKLKPENEEMYIHFVGEDE